MTPIVACSEGGVTNASGASLSNFTWSYTSETRFELKVTKPRSGDGIAFRIVELEKFMTIPFHLYNKM